MQEVYALYPKDNNKYFNLGKLSVATYEPQTHDVVLVPVKNAYVDVSAIEQKLKEVYGPIGVTWNVTKDANYDFAFVGVPSPLLVFFTNKQDEIG